MKKKVLGRGLEALIPESEPSRHAASTEIDIDLIQPNPEQPRFKMREEGLEQLAASIRANGVLQPVLVRPAGDGYQLVAGERRMLAAQRAGLLKVPALIREVPDDHLLELALIENIQREDLNPIEEAQAYQNLLEHLKLTQEELAARLGKERSTVANSLRLLKLPSQVRLLVAEGQLSAGHARALLASNSTSAEMTRIAATIMQQGWSVRMTERWAKKETSQRERTPKPQDPNVAAAADKLRILLGTKVDIVESQSPKGAGQIRVHFYSSEDLARLYGILTEKRR